MTLYLAVARFNKHDVALQCICAFAQKGDGGRFARECAPNKLIRECAILFANRFTDCPWQNCAKIKHSPFCLRTQWRCRFLFLTALGQAWRVSRRNSLRLKVMHLNERVNEGQHSPHTRTHTHTHTQALISTPTPWYLSGLIGDDDGGGGGHFFNAYVL